MINFIKEYAKTFAAFFAGVVGNAIVNLINGSVPWPQTGAEWWQFVLTTFGPAIGTWITRNKITQKQLDKDPNVIGGTVVSDAQIATKPVVNPTTGSEYRNPWQ